MPRPKVYEHREPRSFSVDVNVYNKLKQLLAAQGKNISAELNEWMQTRIAELEGTALNMAEHPSYETLKVEHERLYRKALQQYKLIKQRGTLDALFNLAKSLGLDDAEYGNVAEVAPKLLEQWQGMSTHAYMYVAMLQNMQRVKELERQLTTYILDNRPETATETATAVA